MFILTIEYTTNIDAISKTREIDSQTVQDSLFFGDLRESIMHEAGDFVIPLQEKRISEEHLKGNVNNCL